MTDPDAPTAGPSAAPSTPLAPVGWAFYLASSWTWCIGMFLPVLLVRDFGLWGYLVFAVPNVIGAAAMGWVLRSREQAARIATTHAGAVGAFSVVTTAFHAFWLAWLVTWVRAYVALPAAGWPALVIGSIAFILAAGFATRRGPGRALAALVWAVGAGLLVATFTSPAISPPTDAYLTASDPGVLWLAPVCVFGFALCPYLDATFLRARGSTSPAGSRLAFTLGFGALFFTMILLTLRYAGFFASTGILNPNPPARLAIAPWLGFWLLVHLVAQLVFTVEVHYERLAAMPTRLAQGAALPAVLAAALLGFFWRELPMVGGMSSGEVLYRVFMSFYGLVFPAYVWLCMIPTRGGHAGVAGSLGKRKLAVLAGAVALAAPAYWVGFVLGHEVWLGAGLAVVLLSRLLVHGGAPAGTPG